MELSMLLPIIATMFFVYALIRRHHIDKSAKTCSTKFCVKIKLASEEVIDATDTDKMFYTNDELFFRFWNWGEECCIKDKRMYHKVIGA